MRRKQTRFVNDIVITSADKYKPLKKIKALTITVPKRKRIRNIKVLAMRVLRDAGWNVNMIARAMDVAPRTVIIKLGLEELPSERKKRRPISSYWVDQPDYERKFKSDLEEEGVL
jgi:hypothetical protein